MIFFALCIVNFHALSASPIDDLESNSIDGSHFIDVSQYGPAVFGKPSETTGNLVGEWHESSNVNPEEMGEYFEGDILFPRVGKNGLVAFSAKWDAGIVPYVIQGPYGDDDIEMIYKAMEQYHKNTCIRFRRKQPDDVDYIAIANSKTGCWSSVGKIGGVQELNLQSPGCLSTVGTPVHELMHALGFHHEQNRYERDEFVTILRDNIKQGHEGNFDKVQKDITTAYGVGYDYGSVMHYSGYAFSKNQQPTIVTRDPSAKIGQRDGFSVSDIVKVRKMYNCTLSDENNNTPSAPHVSTTAGSFIDELGEFVNNILG